MTDTPPLTVLHIARSYGISSAYIRRLSGVAGLTREDWREPDLIFRKLLERSHSPLRRKIADPATRNSIRKALQ